MSTSTAPMSTMDADPPASKELPVPDDVQTSAPSTSTDASSESPPAASLQVPDIIAPSDVITDSNTIGDDDSIPRGRDFVAGPKPKPARAVKVHFVDPYFSEESPSRPATPSQQPKEPDPPITSPPHAPLPPPLIPHPPPPIPVPPPPASPPPPPPEPAEEDDALGSTTSDTTPSSDIDMDVPVPVPPPPPPPPPPPSDFPPVSKAESVKSVIMDDPPPPPPPPGPPQPLDITYNMIISSGDPQLPRVNPSAQRIYDRFMNDLSTFVRMQEDTTRLRVQVQEKRTALRIHRQNVSDRDRVFMDALRVSWINGTTSTDDKLEELYQKTQSARDQVGPSEDDYEEIEGRLGAAEFALKEQYEELQRKFDHFFKLQVGTTTIATHMSDISFESSSSVREGEPRNAAMLNGAFLGDSVKVGELPLLTPLPQEPESHTSATQSKHDSSAFPDAHRRSTVLTAEDVPKGMVGDDYIPLEITAPDLKTPDIWRMAHETRGIGDLATIPEGEPTHGGDENVWGDGGDLLLLGADMSSQSILSDQSTLSDYLRDFTSTRERINMWILHKLRISPWEMYELERSVVSEHGERIPDWAQMALDVWKTDPATKDLGYGPDSVEEDSIEQQPAVQPSRPPPMPPPPDGRKRQRRNRFSGHKSEPANPKPRVEFATTTMAVRQRVT